MLRILHFISNSVRSPYLCAIADYTDRRRFALSMGTLSADGDLHADMVARGIPCFALGVTRRWQYPWAVLRLASYLRRHRVNILQTHLVDASFVGLAASRLAGTPLSVLTRHHADAVLLTRRILPILVDRVCSRLLAQRVIAVSDWTSYVLRRREGLARRNIAVIPYGFDFRKLQPTPEGVRKVRELWRLDGRLTLATVARLDPLKGHDHLFRALARLVPAHPNVVLLIVGEGPERERLERLRADLSIEQHIIFTGHRRDVPDVLGAADLLVHPSLSESFGQVLIEACAAGKPVLATDVGVAREIIVEGVTGLIVPPDDPEALYVALADLLSRSNLWSGMGAKGRERVQSYSAQRMVDAYERHCRQWLDECRRN